METIIRVLSLFWPGTLIKGVMTFHHNPVIITLDFCVILERSSWNLISVNISFSQGKQEHIAQPVSDWKRHKESVQLGPTFLLWISQAHIAQCLCGIVWRRVSTIKMLNVVKMCLALAWVQLSCCCTPQYTRKELEKRLMISSWQVDRQFRRGRNNFNQIELLSALPSLGRGMVQNIGQA